MIWLVLWTLACNQSGTIDLGPGEIDTALDPCSGDDQAADPSPDYSRWQGTRDLYYGDCEGRLEEEGQILGTEWEHYDLAESWCMECVGFYQLEVSPDRVCGLDVQQEVYRALWFNEEGAAAIYNLDLQGDSWEIETLDDDASFDGWEIGYSYEIQTWGEDPLIDGLIRFPAQMP